jgi:glycosyltransferase involved in cell wall biosynthesis
MALIDHLALGGAEMLLSQFVAAAPSARIRVSVACLAERDGNPAGASLRAAGVDPVTLGTPGRPGLKILRAVRGHIAALAPQLVHTHLGTSDWVGGLASRSLGVPVISTLHTAVWARDPELYLKRLVVRLCAARMVAVSAGARDAYAGHGWASRRQLVTIPNGIDVDALPGTGAQVRREFGWDETHFVVGMLSALRPEKAHDVAVEAVGLLRQELPSLRLLIVGSGPEGERIRRLARPLGDVVAMAGARSDVMSCMDAFDVCLHPSRADAFPTTLIEAMAASVPVLATRVGGIPEIVADGRTGVLIPAPPSAEVVARALGCFYSDAPRRAELARAASSEYERRFTAGPWIRAIRAVYDEVLAQRGGR